MRSAQEILRQYDAMLARRATYEGDLQDCAEYIRPLRATIGVKPQEGGIDVRTVYDSTALEVNHKLGARLTGTLCSQAIEWFGINVREKKVNNETNSRRWLDDAAEIMLAVMAQSPYYAEINEAFTDLPGLGTGGVFAEPRAATHPGFNGLTFKSIGIGELAIDEGEDGLVDVVGRTFELSHRAAMAKWEGKLHPDTVKRASVRPEEKMEVLHFVEPRKGAEKSRLDAEGKPVPITADKLPWASYYLERRTKHVIEVSGYHEMPFAIGRWSRPSGDLYGRGIGHDALPTIKTLNKSQELFLDQFALAIRPPFKSRRGVKTVRLVPGGRTEVQHPDDLQEWITQARFDVTNAGISALRDDVRRMWMDDQLTLKESPQMTATEVMARLELMQQLLGPNVARVMHEVLNRIIERVFGICQRANLFPPVPDRLREYVRSTGGWDIEYQSPLARSQRLPELTAIDRTLASAQVLMTVEPTVKDVIRLDDTLRHIADVNGVPAKLVNDADEVKRLRAVRAQAQQEVANMQQMNMIAEAAGAAAPMVKALNAQQGPPA